MFQRIIARAVRALDDEQYERGYKDGYEARARLSNEVNNDLAIIDALRRVALPSARKAVEAAIARIEENLANL